MAFPERFSNLPDYAFPRLRKLLDAHAPGGEPIAMTIGEPRHAMPDFVGRILAGDVGEAPEVGHIGELRAAGRDALVASGADREGIRPGYGTHCRFQ